ncbi:hypothetical protein E2C01_012997 [Portunus trituberculatus]|uniref:Uncharacterized protein n=1 Tax=Portunus trituberculatus TaxID=210409 RepID=A0A5B7DFS4_PORTR|nr:hypothetical protein [Portunus trituberculatus]
MSQRHSFICDNTGPLAPVVVLCHREGDTGMLKICILNHNMGHALLRNLHLTCKGNTMVFGNKSYLEEAKSRKCVGVRHSEKGLRHLSRHSWQMIDAALLVSGDPQG